MAVRRSLVPLPLRPLIATVALLGALLLLAWPGRPVGATAGALPPGPHKVVAAPGALAGVAGATLLAEYGSYDLYRVAEATLAALPADAAGSLRAADEMDWLLLDGATFDSQRQPPPALPATLQVVGEGARLHLVQFVGPIRDEWLAEIERAGATAIQYVANNGYLVWADAPSRARLDALAAQGAMLQFSAPYQPAYKVGATLRAALARGQDESRLVTVAVQRYAGAGPSGTPALLASLAVAQPTPWVPLLHYENSIVRLRLADVATLAAQPDVTWVGERGERELHDEVQGQLVAGNWAVGHGHPSGPGYLPWLLGYGFPTESSAYPVVDITDDGVGGGDAPTLPGSRVGDPTLDPRVLYRISCLASLPGDGRGQGGHGHLNASIAFGNDGRAGDPFRDAEGFQRGLGINPFGRLGSTRLFAGVEYDLSLCGGTETGVIEQSYRAGARILSNSWGCSGCQQYDESSQAYDVAVRDADSGTAGNQPLLTFFSAGNSGPGAGTVGSPGNAKNVVTIGASESVRPTWSDGCGIGPSGADHAHDIIPFSSRGPVVGNRSKPDLVAPGTHIQGTASPHPAYTGYSICDKVAPVGQSIFAASSGTSHSTPAVAAIASLYDWWLRDRYALEPSPALMKGFLIAHPTFLTGAGAGDSLPSPAQGYGMPNMALALDETPRFLLDQSVRLRGSGEVWHFAGTVADPSLPLRVVLAYTDAPGAIGSSPQVNDLDLAATVGGLSYAGNNFAGAWSVAGGARDGHNNVEAIFLPAGARGPFELTVTAFNVGGDGVPGNGDATDQDFALVCYNCIPAPDFSLTVAPSELALCLPNSAPLTVTLGAQAAFAEPVSLSVAGLPPGVSASIAPNPVTPPETTTLTLAASATAQPGRYTVQVQGQAAGRAHSVPLALALFDGPPVAPTLLAPTAGSSPATVTLEWAALAQATSYTLEVAGDAAFSEPLLVVPGLEGTSFTATLPSARQIFWRVRAANGCGAGAFSPVASFVTEPGAGQCPVGAIPRTLLAEDFEGAMAGWSHEGLSDSWARSSARSQSGSGAMLAQAGPSRSDQRLVSPVVALPEGLTGLALSFWHDQSLEGRTGGGCFDGALLELSRYNTSSGSWGGWKVIPPSRLAPFSAYNGAIASGGNFDNPLAGAQAWCGDPQPWSRVVVALDEYAGERLRFRFRLGTDSSTGRLPHGWYVDDVTVQGCELPIAESLFLPLLSR